MQTLLRTRKTKNGSAEMRAHRSFRKATRYSVIDTTETCFAGKTKLTMSQLRDDAVVRQVSCKY